MRIGPKSIGESWDEGMVIVDGLDFIISKSLIVATIGMNNEAIQHSCDIQSLEADILNLWDIGKPMPVKRKSN